MEGFKKQYTAELQNDWALTKDNQQIYIDDAKSGRKGYSCIGCKKEMEAVIQHKDKTRRSYFRHVAVDVNEDEAKCTFSNQQYRETLAADILQRLKSIKVSSIIKYPSKNDEGMDPIKLEDSHFVDAHKVRSNIVFYVSADGSIKNDKLPKVPGEDQLIRFDVVFYDIDDRPILLIDFVEKHKLDEQKKALLKTIGINAVSVIIPRTSPEEIENNFKSVTRIKWMYNELEATTSYVSAAGGYSKRVSEFDRDQRINFEESYTCRKTRLSNLIRRINKCLQ